MENLLIFLILCVIILAAFAAYLVGSRRGDRNIIDKQAEWLGLYRDDIRDWQNKALFRQGVSPLGRETAKTEKPESNGIKNVPVTVGHRGMRMARMEGEEQQSITIHGHKVTNPRTEDTVEKAREIKKQQEINAE